jgi:hypothetical protein
MELPPGAPHSSGSHTAGHLDVRCGYCGKHLASVAFIYSRARPACGSAWCLQQALHDSEAAEPQAA